MLIIGLFLCFGPNYTIAQENQSKAESEDTSNFSELKPNAISFGYLGAGEARNGSWPLPSIAYRRQLKEGYVRVLVGGYFEQQYANNRTFEEINSISGKVGYQYRIINTRLSPKVGIDLSGGSFYRNYIYADNDGYQKESTAYVGLSPNLGLEFWITPAISLSIETRMDFLIREMKEETLFNYEINPTVSSRTTSDFFTRYSPISLFYISIFL